MLENVLIFVIVAAAAGYLVLRFRRKGGSCGCGCSSECSGGLKEAEKKNDSCRGCGGSCK